MSGVRVAAVQMVSGEDIGHNLERARALIATAACGGARLVVLPEAFACYGSADAGALAGAERDSAGPLRSFLAATAREHGILLVGGTIPVAGEAPGARPHAACFLYAEDGSELARYDKIHLFDVNLAGGESYRESNTYKPGEVAITADLPWGRLGLTICYDLRFPALYRALASAGAHFLSVPAAFTKQTGEAHWHVLLRARAIETGSFVFAAAQGGRHENGRDTYGHSLIVDPWGRVLAEGGTDPAVVIAEIDVEEVARVRARIPSLEHGRRFEVAGAAQEHSHLHLVGKAS